MIFITTPTGTVGSELVKTLKSSRTPFRAGFRSPTKAEEAKASGLDTAVFDFERPDTFSVALRGIEKLFLLSPPGRTHLEATLIDAAKSAGVKHVVKLSVWGAETEAFSFAHHHRPMEKKLEKSGIPYTLLRPNGFMQNFVTSFAATIKGQGTFYLPDSDAKISVIDVRDIAAVAAKILTSDGQHSGRAYTLSGPESLSNAEIAEKLSRAIGKKITYVNVSDADFKKGLLGSGVPEQYAGYIIDLQHYYVAGSAATVTPDVEKITGRKPITFDQFAQDYVSAFQ